MAPRRVWTGNESLRKALVPVGNLREHQRNPRRGEVDLIAESLTRFGQQRPILVAEDGSIIAGNHTWKAAREIGWTHIAIVRTDLRGKDDLERYLIADNRTSDLGTYDNAQLLTLLREVREKDGTGYDADAEHELAALTRESAPPAEAQMALRMILRYDEATYRAMTERLDALMAEHGDDSYSAAIERAVDAAA